MTWLRKIFRRFRGPTVEDVARARLAAIRLRQRRVALNTAIAILQTNGMKAAAETLEDIEREVCGG